MPLSSAAITAIRNVARWNPRGIATLLAVLTEFPQHMKYKDDPYGPLSLPLIAEPARTPFPEEQLPTCKVFGEEWLSRAFTKGEFRQALELALKDEAKR
jgi:hypothetical protein